MYAVFNWHINKPYKELFKKVQLLKKIELRISKDVMQYCE